MSFKFLDLRRFKLKNKKKAASEDVLLQDDAALSDKSSKRKSFRWLRQSLRRKSGSFRHKKSMTVGDGSTGPYGTASAYECVQSTSDVSIALSPVDESQDLHMSEEETVTITTHAHPVSVSEGRTYDKVKKRRDAADTNSLRYSSLLPLSKESGYDSVVTPVRPLEDLTPESVPTTEILRDETEGNMNRKTTTEATIATTAHDFCEPSIEDLLLEKVPRATNLWYSSDTKMTFEELYMPGMDKSSYQSAPQTQLMIHKLRPAVWSTTDGRMFQVLTYPSSSHKADITDLSSNPLPTSDDTQPRLLHTLHTGNSSVAAACTDVDLQGSAVSLVKSLSVRDSSLTQTSDAVEHDYVSLVKVPSESIIDDADDMPEINNSTGYIDILSPIQMSIEQPTEETEILKNSRTTSDMDGNLSSGMPDANNFSSGILEINNSEDFTVHFPGHINQIKEEQPFEETKIFTKKDKSDSCSLSPNIDFGSADTLEVGQQRSISLELPLEKLDETDNKKDHSLALPTEVKGDVLKCTEGDHLKSRKLFRLEEISSVPTQLEGSHLLNDVLEILKKEKQTQPHLNSDFAELCSEIAWILAGYDDIIAPLYCPSPQNYNKLLVQGPGVAKAKKAIKELQAKYPSYEIFLSDRQPVMRSKDNVLPIYTRPLADTDPKMPCYVHKNIMNKNANYHIATVGTFVKDGNPATDGLLFGVTAAHAILTRDEQERLAEHAPPETYSTHTRAICQDLIGRTHMSERLSIAPHNHQPVHVRDSPLVAYNHFIPTPESDQPQLQPFQKFISDIAILPVDANRLEQLDIAVTSFLSSRSVHPVLSDNPTQKTPQTPIGGYIDMNDASDIAKLLEANVKIIIEGIPTAKLQIQPETFTQGTLLNHAKTSDIAGMQSKSVPQWKIAPHFAFTSDKALTPGCSGTPVLVYDTANDVFYVIGLLMGVFEGTLEWSTDVLYQAMPFGPALKQLMFLYDQHLNNLRPVVGEPIPASLALPIDIAEHATKTVPVTRQHSRDVADELVRYLVQKGPVEDYHAVPKSLLQLIERVAQERDIECGVVYQSPEDPKELQIIGVHASSMSDVISLVLIHFPSYSISLDEIPNPLHHIEYAGNAVFSVQKQTLQGRRNSTDSYELHELHNCTGRSHCGVIMAGRTLARYPIHAYYVVVPAHLVLGDFCERLLKIAELEAVDLIKQEVEGVASKTKYTLHMHNSTNTCDIQPLPMFSYRHFHLQDDISDTYRHFTNDMALLKIEPDQVCDEGVASQSGIIQFSDIASAMTQTVDFPCMPIGPSNREIYTKIGAIFPLQHPSTLFEMARQRVCVTVGPGRGYMVPCGEPISWQQKSATFSIEFVLTDWKLQPGDCGAVLYVQDTRDGHDLYPFGMFIGKSHRTPRCGFEIYRAVVLSQAIEEIEAEYGYLVSDLKPLKSPGTQYTDRDTGLGQSTFVTDSSTN